MPSGGPVRGAAAPLTFDTPISSPATAGAGKEAHADG
jgi:NADH-quinone oxidoreductase subunit H